MNFGSNSQLLNEAAELEKVWASTKLLDGITDRKIRQTTAVLLENQRLMNEVATDTSDVANFKRISIPLVRRIFPQLIANKIVSVQPLLGPAGLVYYLRFRYASNKGSTRGGSLAGFPTDDASSMQQTASGTANLDIWFAHQFVSNETQTSAGGGTALTYTVERTPVIGGTVTGTIYVGATAIQYFTVSSAGTFTFTSIGAPATTVSAGSLDLTTGIFSLTWSADPGANSIIVSYEYNMECQQDLPEVNMTVESEEVAAKTRKLKAVWTYEAQQDLRSQHNIDAEAELTGVLATEINLEIDREVLTDLRLNAGTVASWDYATALGDTIKERYESLYVKLVELSNVIHRKTLRGQANWLVTSPEVASIFETATAGFAPQTSENFTSSLGVQYVGTISGKWRMYKDPLFPSNQILFGYKGDTNMDTGYYFLPYVPLTQTPVVLDPDSFCPRKGLLTRYSKKLLREGAKYYGRLVIANWSL